MLDYDTRAAVLELKKRGRGNKSIAKAMGISCKTVRRVLAQGHAEVPRIQREQTLEKHESLIRKLYAACKGNLVRVHEELLAEEIDVPYSTLTGFCRRVGIGVKEKVPVGHYEFEPGQEMQHDTSPHNVVVGGQKRLLQCASLVLCFSRVRFAQAYPTFNRYYCKLFLTEAIEFFGGAAGDCMVDNTHVVVESGTGANAVMTPEMVSFGRRFGFSFVAHEKGDANRSAHVERGFDYIERNFYPGRTFADLRDLNNQLKSWCEKVNGSFKRHLQARPMDLFQTEALHLKPLPLFIPEVFATHLRVVDQEGYISLHTNRYSVPVRFIGLKASVHEGKGRVRIFVGHELVATHERLEEGRRTRRTLPEHRESGRWQSKNKTPPPLHEEVVLRNASPTLERFVEALRVRKAPRRNPSIRSLYRLYLDYPLAPLEGALVTALNYGLFDIARIERMVLKNIAGDFFRLPIQHNTDTEDDDDQ